jgi:hypothetical protein
VPSLFSLRKSKRRALRWGALVAPHRAVNKIVQRRSSMQKQFAGKDTQAVGDLGKGAWIKVRANTFRLMKFYGHRPLLIEQTQREFFQILHSIQPPQSDQDPASCPFKGGHLSPASNHSNTLRTSAAVHRQEDTPSGNMPKRRSRLRGWEVPGFVTFVSAQGLRSY